MKKLIMLLAAAALAASMAQADAKTGQKIFSIAETLLASASFAYRNVILMSL